MNHCCFADYGDDDWLSFLCLVTITIAIIILMIICSSMTRMNKINDIISVCCILYACFYHGCDCDQHYH